MNKKSKQELLQQINKTESLEIIVTEINRAESASSKQSKQNEFANKAKEFVKDERDVLLIAIRVK